MIKWSHHVSANGMSDTNLTYKFDKSTTKSHRPCSAGITCIALQRPVQVHGVIIQQLKAAKCLKLPVDWCCNITFILKVSRALRHHQSMCLQVIFCRPSNKVLFFSHNLLSPSNDRFLNEHHRRSWNLRQKLRCFSGGGALRTDDDGDEND